MSINLTLHVKGEGEVNLYQTPTKITYQCMAEGTDAAKLNKYVELLPSFAWEDVDHIERLQQIIKSGVKFEVSMI